MREKFHDIKGKISGSNIEFDLLFIVPDIE